MKWVKMPKNIDAMGIPLKHVPLVAEIIYFANSRTGEITLNSRSLISKYSKTTLEHYKTILKLIENKIIHRGNKKGQYFYNFNWDCDALNENKSETNKNKSETTLNTLTIDKKRIDKNKEKTPQVAVELLHDYNTKFNKRLTSKVFLGVYSKLIDIGAMTQDEIKMSHSYVAERVGSGNWTVPHNPENLFGRKASIQKRLGEIDGYEPVGDRLPMRD